MTKGVAAFKNATENQIFAGINPEAYLRQTSESKRVFQHFGLEDSIVNHVKLFNYQIEGKRLDFLKSGETLLSKRHFTVISIKNSECLTLNFSDIDRMRKEFVGCSRSLFKMMID